MSTPRNNFLIFNEANNEFTTMSDSDYASDLYRINGLIPMIADPIAHNKMFRQWSIMAKAIADMICDKGYDALDTSASDLKNNLKTSVKDLARDELNPEITTLGNIDTWKESITATPAELNTLDGITASTSELNTLDGITASTSELNTLDGITVSTSELNCLNGVDSNIQTQINNLAISAFIPLWTASRAYSVGDVVKTLTSSFWVYLECVVAGTSDTTKPTFTNVGELVTDGTVKWLVLDLRDSAPVGTIKQDIIKRDGWLKLNGATVNVADYPRLVSFLTANSLIHAYTVFFPVSTNFTYGDSNNETLILPDFEGLFIENSASNTLDGVSAGLPNITGEYKPKLAMSGYNMNRNKISVDIANGAFKNNLYSGTYAINGGLTYDTGYTDQDPKGVTFDASRSSSIYGNSNTVQPPAVYLIPVIKY
jgi:hypothetical protein